MKFNEDLLKKLLQQEKTEWDMSDLSWFDEDLLLKFEGKQLSQSEHDNLLDMMVHDQAVLDHYLHLKQQLKSTEKAQNSFSKYQWLLISFTAIAVVLMIGLNAIDGDDNREILTRGGAEFAIYPADQAMLREFPSFFMVPNSVEQMKIELLSDNEVVWSSDWQKTVKFLFPDSERSHLTHGEYQWRVVSKGKDELHAAKFTVVN